MTNRRTPPYYNREFVEREFTPKQVAEQGRYLLYRALNIGRAIGFVGAGISAAYGRPTWTHLVDEPSAAIRRKFVEAHGDTDTTFAAQALDEALVEGVSDVDLLPLKAHLARTLSDRSASEDPLQAEVKRRVKDDDFPAFNAWRDFLPTELLRAVPFNEIESKGILGTIRAMDTWGGLRAVVTILTRKREFAAPLKAIDEHLMASPHEDTSRLSVEERYMVPLLLSVAHLTARLPEIRRELSERIGRMGDSVSSDANRPPSLDPAGIIFDRLRFRRLLTTNYDFELERALERIGFQSGEMRPDGRHQPQVSSVDRSLQSSRPRGDRARTLVLGKNTAAELTGFAVQASGFDYEVFHLHGRAISGIEEPLVITERDYQAVYLRDSPEAHVMDEALTATMGGNPIVFLGMGMLEADILRPLRRFVSGPTGQHNRSIVAIMPAEERQARRVRSVLHLYLRYGVHTIFYGDEPSEDVGASRYAKDFQPAPWMGGREEALEERAPLYRSIARLRSLRKALDDHAAEFQSLKRWIRTGAFRTKRIAEICSEIAWQEFGPGKNGADALSLTRAAAMAVLQSDAFWRRGDDASRSARGAVRAFLGEVDGRIRTRALCRTLNKLADDRLNWWQQWREPPAHRRFAHDVRVAGPDGDWTKRADLSQPLLLAADAATRTIRSVRFAMPHSPNDQNALSVVAKITRQRPLSSLGRRVFVVHCDNGAGRGSFFHQLAKSFARGGFRGENAEEQADYAWGLFTNATFSTEYSSVIDGINDFLDHCINGPGERIARKSGRPPRSRRAAVLWHLEAMYGADSVLKPNVRNRRGLLVIGGAELLFRRRDGTPKNFEIVEALAAFLGEETERYPLDVVIVCRADKPIFGLSAGPLNGEHSACFGRRPDGSSLGPQFDAEFLHLRPPPIRQLIDRDLDAADLGNVKERLAELDQKTKETLAAVVPDWRQAMRGRFQSSIVMQCAITTYKVARGEGRTPAECLRAVMSFLVDLGDASSRADGRRTADVALSAVLRQYMSLSEARTGVSPEFCEILLKHLAIMSTPVEIVVLERCPEIERWLERNAADRRRKLLVETLKWLERHRLCFRIASRREFAGSAGWEWHDFTRLTVHQSLQSYFFRQIGSPHLEFGDSRLFTVSVFASQRADLPAPSLYAYEFMRDLIRRLIKYPDQRVSVHDERGEAAREADVCALRASLGLVRSAFSLAVVSRFAEFGDPKHGLTRAFGYMEEFRLLLRWMIFQAGMLGIEDTKELKRLTAKEAEHRKRERINALYPDEITWLYNECGLVSLAQGNLYDAAALLDAARVSNEKVEVGSARGPNALRIRLNAAVARFERGHLERANDELARLRQESDREPVVAAIARGYQGLVAHLKGRRKQASEYYGEALEALRRHGGEARAISIFNRHYGDLMRSEDVVKARELHRAALAEAENARQHDQVQRAQIAIVNDELVAGALRPEHARRLVHQIEEVMLYADRMEIYSLKCEALTARARLIELQGETRGAGEAAIAALSLATLHGQRLRAIMALNIVGRVVAGRPGYRDQARRILRSARAMAEEADYQLVLETADRRLIELGTLN